MQVIDSKQQQQKSLFTQFASFRGSGPRTSSGTFQCDAFTSLNFVARWICPGRLLLEVKSKGCWPTGFGQTPMAEKMQASLGLSRVLSHPSSSHKDAMPAHSSCVRHACTQLPIWPLFETDTSLLGQGWRDAAENPGLGKEDPGKMK